MSDTPPRSDPPARPDGLIDVSNPSVDPLSGRPPAPRGSDHSTVTNARAPTDPNTEPILDIPGYAIVGKIGEGGMGSVFLATDARIGRKVAIKTMRPELAAVPRNFERFVREARTASLVEHDNIVPIWQVGEASDGTPFIAMPFLKGEPLDARLRREPAALDLVLKVAREVAEGLAAAHAAGLIHRDIKPGNVWLEGDPAAREFAEQVRRCKILDFGLARTVEQDDAHLTASGAILGTPAFMAPEQALGQKVDARADLFSLGVMLYRMATGEQPFKGDSAYAVLAALATVAPPPVGTVRPDLPPALAQLIDRLMCKDANGRPRFAKEVAEIVRQIEGTGASFGPRMRTPTGPVGLAETVTHLPEDAPEEVPPWLTRGRVTELAGVAALVPLITAACVAPGFAARPPAEWTTLVRAFLLATALGWAAALAGRMPEADGWRRWGRYAVQFAVGAGIGVLALWLEGWALLAESADGRDFVLAGAHVGRDTVLTGAQYALFFGLAVCAVRWGWASLGALLAPEGRTFRPSWDLLRGPAMIFALWLVWPTQLAPLGYGALIVVGALVAQVARPLSRSAPAPKPAES